MEDKVIEIIENVTGYKNLKENIDIDLLENEILDSMSFIELISFLEDEFDIEIQPTTVSSDTWRNVGKIVELVKKLK